MACTQCRYVWKAFLLPPPLPPPPYPPPIPPGHCHSVPICRIYHIFTGGSLAPVWGALRGILKAIYIFHGGISIWVCGYRVYICASMFASSSFAAALLVPWRGADMASEFVFDQRLGISQRVE